MVRKAYKFRLYPNKEQTEKLQWTLARCCEVYNACLQERRDAWANIKRHPRYWETDGTRLPNGEYDYQWRKQAAKEHSISLYDQQNQLSPMKKERDEYQQFSAAHILNDVCKRVDLAFQHFFDRVKKGQTPGYPRYHSNKRYDSFCYPDSSGWKLEGKQLILTRIGTIKVKLHRPIEGTIKTCTIKREGEHWYVIFSCEVEIHPQSAYTDETVGIDLGVNPHFAALSTGDTIDHPRYFRKMEKRLEQAQRILSRKKLPHHNPNRKGNKNPSRRQKAGRRVATLHRKTARQRKDFLHKHSRTLVDTYDTLVFEELQTANLTRHSKVKQDAETGRYLPNGASAKAGLNKSILDAGWATFIQYCFYKAAWAGRKVEFVDPKYTSQTCPGCGQIKKKELSERWHSCECGYEGDRDIVAAINIRIQGLKKIEGRSAGTPEQRPSQITNEAGSASAFALLSSFSGEEARWAAESPSASHPSQDGLWNSS